MKILYIIQKESLSNEYKKNFLEMVHHPVLLKVMKLLSPYLFFIYNFFISDLLGWAFGSNLVDQPSDLWVKTIRKAVINIELVRLHSLNMNLIGARLLLYFSYICLNFLMTCGSFYIDLALKKYI